MKQSKPHPLDKTLFRLLIIRLFLPSLIITLVAIGLTGHVWGRGFGERQLQLARSLALTIDEYLENASQVLNGVAQVASATTPSRLEYYMQSTWQAHQRYFDTIYHLNEAGRVTMLVPDDPRYRGVDMSRQPYFLQSQTQSDVVISNPFTSLRTGQPTVYIAYPLSNNETIVGELSLKKLQDITTSEGDEQYFVVNRAGTFLAHPQRELVAQQANVSHLKIVKRGLMEEATALYLTQEGFALGSATQTERTGWIVVAQNSLSTIYGPYALAVGLALILAPTIWAVMILNFREQLKRQVVAPLAQLNQFTTALAAGDFDQGAKLANIPTTFAELTALRDNFLSMSQTIQARQTALQKSEEKYRTILENIQDGYYETDLAGNLTFFNDALCRILGHSADELMGLNYRAYMTDENAQATFKAFNTVYRTGQPIQAIDGEVIQSNGSKRVIETSASLITGPDSAPTGFRGIARDVTERKLAEKEIRQRTAQLEALRQVSLKITAQLDLDLLLGSIVSQAVQLLDGTAGELDLYQPDRDVLEWIASAGEPVEPIETIIHRGEGLSGKVWETDKPIIVGDYSREKHLPDSKGYPFSSAVGVPIHWGEEFLGVLLVVSEAPRAFSTTDATLLGLFATQASIAIRNARLYEETHRRAAHLSALNTIIAVAAAASDIKTLLEIALSQTLTALGLKMGAIWLIDSHATRCLPAEFAQRTIQATQSLGPTSPYPIAVEDWHRVKENDPPLSTIAPVMAHYNVRASLSVPIITEEGHIGGMTIASQATRAWSGDDIALAEAIGQQMGAAAERLRLFKAEQQQRELAEALEEAAAAISSTLDPDQVLDHILEQVERIVPGEAYNIMLVEDAHAQMVRWRGYENVSSEAPYANLYLPSSPNLLKMSHTGKPIIVQDTTANPASIRMRRWEWLRSYVGAPIRVADKTVGFLIIDSTQPSRFDSNDAQRLQAFASHAATAIENARLFKETQKRVAELEALQRTSMQLTSSLDLNAVLETIVTSVLNLTKATDCHIYLYDEELGSFVLGAALWKDGEKKPATGVPQPDGLTATVAQTGRPIIINDARSHPLYTRQTHAIAGLPLKRAGRILGVLNTNYLQPHTFTPEELRILNLLAVQAAIAIENAQLYQQSRDHADQLEQRVQERTSQLQSQYARLDAILSSASDGIIVTNIDGEIIQTNPIAQAWLNQTLSPNDAAELRAAVKELARQANTGTLLGKKARMILELTGLDLALQSSSISDPTSEEATAVIAVHDVSHLKALNRMKSRFVTNISHELRTPVTTIKLYATLLQQTKTEDAKWKQYLDALTKEAEHQAQLVQDILQISRIDAGRLEIKPSPTSLNHLIETVVNTRMILAEEQGLILKHHLPEPGLTALVDAERMKQVLNNLVANAIRYTPKGGNITVSTGTKEAQGRTWATVTVADTGIGIPKEELPHIFDRFFRGTTPRNMQISGTGLGLAIAREIVELHGGCITVESEVNVGTLFTIWLPLAAQLAPFPPPHPRQPKQKQRGKQ